MNFIGMIESSQVQVELKYCERCGGLFLQPQGTDLVYCAGCAARLAAQPEFAEIPTPSARSKKRNPRLVKGPKLRERQLQGAAQIDYLQGVAAVEVRSC
jgi:Zn-finger nucleic acid-binding protein